jgi:hypothetical protein
LEENGGGGAGKKAEKERGRETPEAPKKELESGEDKRFTRVRR